MRHARRLPATTPRGTLRRGAAPEEIAWTWGYSAQTIYRDLRRIGDIVLGHTGLEGNPVLLARWFDMHLDDCLPIARVVIQRRTVFSQPPAPDDRHHAAWAGA